METTVKKNVSSKKSNKNSTTMTERQIKRKVGEAWAFLENPVYDDRGVMKSANLLYYNADKKKVWEHSRKYNKGHFAVFYYGTWDKNLLYTLSL